MWWLGHKKKPNFNLILILQVLSYCWVTQWTVTTGKDTLVCNPKTLWFIYCGTFLFDYLSLKGLFYNSVTYQILLNKTLLILTKRGSQWKQKTMNWHWDLILYSYALCPCRLLYLHCLSSVTQTSEKYTLMLWSKFPRGTAWFNVRTSLVLWTAVLTSHEAN